MYYEEKTENGITYGRHSPDGEWFVVRTDTPETDANLSELAYDEEGIGAYVVPDFARKLERQRDQLLEALEAAESHLEYCGYGDSWENSCAEASGLSKQIRDAIASVKGGES